MPPSYKMQTNGMIPLFRDCPALRERLPYVSLASLPTPVERLTHVEEAVGIGRLYIKRDDLSGAVYGGNKVRMLEFLFGRILRTGAKEVMTVGFAGSNHALATAIYAGRLGLKSTSLLMPQPNAHYVRRNLLAGHRYGARLCHYETIPLLLLGIISQWCRGSLKYGVFPRFIPAGGSCPLGVVGFVNAAMELRDQVAAGLLPEPDVIYVAMGSMGTAAGLVLGLKAMGLRTRVIPVRVLEERMAGPNRMTRLIRATVRLLRGLAPEFPRVTVPKEGVLVRNDCIGKGYGHFTREGADAADLVWKAMGLVLNGTYSAKAFAALLSDARAGTLAGRTVLFWNTYNSRDLSAEVNRADYHDLPGRFHRYFEEDVQQLDRQERGTGLALTFPVSPKAKPKSKRSDPE